MNPTPTTGHAVENYAGHTIEIYDDNGKGNPGYKITRPAKTASGIKVIAWYNFRSQQQRDETLNKWKQSTARTLQEKENRKQAKREALAAGHPLKPGTILVSSWGYEQTNVDFYEVISATRSSVVIREIAQTREDGEHFMTGTCQPVPDKFIGEPTTHRVQCYGPAADMMNWYIKLTSYSNARPAEPGRKYHWSSYA